MPHGAACAALLAPVMEANVAALRSQRPGDPVLGRYAEAAVLMTGDPAASIEDGLAWIRETVASLQIPGLAAFGLRPAAARERASGSSASGSGDIGGGDIGEITAKAMRSSSMQGNPVALSTGDLRAILARAA